jgi:hypothetical protein
VTCSDATAVAAGERCRTGVNETGTETRPGTLDGHVPWPRGGSR